MTIGTRTIGHRRTAYTLIELVVAMASGTVLLAGLASAVVVTSRAFRPESSAQYARTTAAFVEQDLLADLRLATGFTERTSKSATFSVPDRNGDGTAETLRYAWSGTSGDPLTLSLNGGPPLTVATNVRSFTLSFLTQSVAAVNLPAEQTGSPILLLVADSQNPTADELARKALIESWNFNVVIKGCNDTADALLAAAVQSKAIYVSGTVPADKFVLSPKVAELAVGIVSEHPGLVDELGFATEAVLNALSSQVSIANNSHYITTGQSSGSVSVGVVPGIYALTGTLAKNLNTLASTSSAFSSVSGPTLATVDTGKLLHDGRTAAGRRVMVPWGGEKCDPTYWNATGQMLTCRAIEWATGLGSDSPEIRKFGYDTVFASSNGTLNIQYATKAKLTDLARVQSLTAYVGGANDEVRFAIYQDNGGQPGSLLVQSNVGKTATAMAWVTLPVSPTDLKPGDYWLAFIFKNSSQRYRYVTTYAGAGERNKSQTFTSGFVSSWGTSNNSYSGARSIYATYEVLP